MIHGSKHFNKISALVSVGGWGEAGRGKRPTAKLHIRKTYLYKFDPIKSHLYIVKLGFTGVYIIFLISAEKHRLWIRVRTASARRF